MSDNHLNPNDKTNIPESMIEDADSQWVKKNINKQNIK